MTRKGVSRAIALAVIVALGGYYIVFDILGYRAGAQDFNVTVLAPQAGGIYKGATVTYRGVAVGRVNGLDVSPDRVAIKLDLDPGTRVPAGTDAHVRELSALGEQYLDLVPTAGGGPYLHSGSTIPASRVTLPVPIGTALLDFGSLLNSINQNELQKVEQFLIQGFTGTGAGLRTIIVSGQNLAEALIAAQAQTRNLIVDGGPVLQTLEATDNQFATFTRGLASVTGQLTRSNTDLAALIANGNRAEAQLNPFLGNNNPDITGTIQALGTDAGVSQEYQPSVQELFQVLPVLAGDLAGSASGGSVRGQLTFNTDGPVCSYVPADQIPLPTQRVSTPPLDNGCASSQPGLLPRGAETAAKP